MRTCYVAGHDHQAYIHHSSALNSSGVNSNNAKRYSIPSHQTIHHLQSRIVKNLAYNGLEGPREFRLLRIQTSELEPIALEVLHVSLVNLLGLYTAISYRWDDSVSKHMVRCGKELLCLNETLGYLQ